MPDVQMDYDAVEAMVSIFRAAAQQLDETITTMTGIAATLEDDGLVGEAGDELVQALRNKLNPSLGRLRDKMHEEEQDLAAAVAYTRDGVQTSRGRFL
jgi:hypothetical protein